MTRSELAWVVSYPVPCGNCGMENLEMVARLISSGDMTCVSCSAVLDLDTAEWTAFRNELKKFHVGKQSPVARVKEQR